MNSQPYSEEETEDIIIPRANEQGLVVDEVTESEPESDSEEEESVELGPRFQMPTKSQFRAQVVNKMVENQASKIAKSPGKPLSKTAFNQASKELASDTAGKNETEEKIRIARRLNDKRQAYAKKIQYKFKPNYDPSKFTLEQLKHEEYELDTIVNSQDVPTILKDGLKAVSFTVEKLLTAFGFPLAKGFSDKMRINVEAQYFDAEFEQLAIDLKDYFARPPVERVLMKSGMIFARTVEENQIQRVTGTVPTPLANKTKDL